MTPNLFFKILKISSAEAFFNLHQKIFRKKGWPLESFSYFLSSPQVLYKAAIAEASGEFLGFILVQFAEDEGEVLTFAVDPAFQRRGIGEALLRKIIGASQEKYLKKIFLEVSETNEAAKKIYQKIGFKPIGKRVKYYSQNGEKSADALTFCYFL